MSINVKPLLSLVFAVSVGNGMSEQEEVSFQSLFIDPVVSSVEYGEKVDRILRGWEANPVEATPMRDIVQATLDANGIDAKSKYAKIALKCAQLGSKTAIDGSKFHAAPAHPRKVLLQTIRLAMTHNQNCNEGSKLGDKELCLLMAAAAIHDLNHDGTNNGFGGDHLQYRLEDIAFESMKTAFEGSGIDITEDDLRTIQVLLKCTDVSSPEGPFAASSPCNIMKRYYCDKEILGVKPEELPEELTLLSDSNILNMALILHTADLASSAGLSLDRTLTESGILADETGVDDIRKPAGILGFIDVSQLLLLPAAKIIYGDARRVIRQKIVEMMPQAGCKLKGAP